MLVEKIGKAATLEQTAEECVELAHAALKLARMYRGDNKVHGKNEGELKRRLEEEVADVIITLQELGEGEIFDEIEVEGWIGFKIERMKRRLGYDQN